MTVRAEAVERTLLVTIDRPERRNAVDRATADRLFETFVAFDTDPRFDAAVLTGANGTFCAGADLLAIAGDEPNDLHIQLGPADFSVPVADLADYEHVETVDALGNALSIRSLACVPTPNGWLAGIWVERHQHRGIFRGAFMNRVGQLEGFLRGHWGVDQGGLRLLFGKYIDREGHFRGILAGTWDPHPGSGAVDAPASGTMEGLWYGRGGEAVGEFGGTYRKGFRRGGYFCGHWQALP